MLDDRAPAALAPSPLAAPGPGYLSRRPETTALYRVVADHLEAFLAEAADADAHGIGVPAFVERTFRNYLACGILAHG